MYIHVCACTYIYIHTYMRIYVCIYTHICIHTHAITYYKKEPMNLKESKNGYMVGFVGRKGKEKC